MKKSAFGIFVTSTAISLVLGACGGADVAEPADAQARLRANLPAIEKATENASTLLDEMPATDWISQSLDSMETTFANLPLDSFTDLNFNLPLGGEDGGSGGSALLAFKEGGDTDISEELILLVFNEESYEGDGYYLLRAEVVCDDGLGGIDPECAEAIQKAEIRFHATLAGDGLDIALAIGPDRVEPITLELRSDRLAVVLDLDAGKDAIVHLSSISGENVELPEVMEGVLAFSLIVHGERDVSLQAAVRQAVRVETALPGLTGRLSLSSAAKDPLVAVRFQGPEKQVTFDLDIGQTILSMPWSEVADNPLAAGAGQTFTMDLGGFSASTTLTEGDESLTIKNIGYGDNTTSLKIDDTEFFALDLNADSGRRFDLTISPNAQGLPSIQVSPGYDLSAKFDMRKLADAGEVVDAFVLNETYRINFKSSDSSTPKATPIENLAGEGGLRIDAGTLTISSTGAPGADVVVEAGQCLLENPAPPVGSHAVLGQLSAGACPTLP